MDSTNNQFRDHSNLYFPYSDGGLVSIQCPLFWAPAKQYRPCLRLSCLLSAILTWSSGTKVTSVVVVTWYFDAQFEYHFSGQNDTTLRACKIVNFYPKSLKLWKRIFQLENCLTKRKYFSLHMVNRIGKRLARGVFKVCPSQATFRDGTQFFRG